MKAASFSFIWGLPEDTGREAPPGALSSCAERRWQVRKQGLWATGAVFSRAPRKGAAGRGEPDALIHVFSVLPSAQRRRKVGSSNVLLKIPHSPKASPASFPRAQKAAA